MKSVVVHVKRFLMLNTICSYLSNVYTHKFFSPKVRKSILTAEITLLTIIQDTRYDIHNAVFGHPCPLNFMIVSTYLAGFLSYQLIFLPVTPLPVALRRIGKA